MAVGRFLSVVSVVVAGLVLSASPAIAAFCDVDGARYSASAQFNRGIRSQVDFVNPTNVPTGVLVWHGMEVDFASSGEILEWITYKGEGYPGCPNNYNDNWRVAVLYWADDGPTTCEAASSWPRYTGADDNVPIKASFGDCGGQANRWRVYTENVLRACLETLNTASGNIRVWAYAWYSPTIRLIDIHFDDLDRMNTSDQWVSWSGGSGCADTGHQGAGDRGG
jgi:hypothetical protein